MYKWLCRKQRTSPEGTEVRALEDMAAQTAVGKVASEVLSRLEAEEILRSGKIWKGKFLIRPAPKHGPGIHVLSLLDGDQVKHDLIKPVSSGGFEFHNSEIGPFDSMSAILEHYTQLSEPPYEEPEREYDGWPQLHPEAYVIVLLFGLCEL